MDEKTELASQKPQREIIPAKDDSTFASYLDTAKFDQTWRVANVFAKTDLVPTHYRNKPENCFLAFIMATRLNQDPFMFMQKTYVINGKMGMEAQQIIALVNARGPFTGPIQWRFEGIGKDKKCTAYATHKITGEVCQATVSWAMVEAEGWNKKTGSKWLTMPDIMFQYRSASFLASLYCPEVKMGMMTTEELQDIDGEGNPVPTRPESPLQKRLKKKVVSTVKQNEPAPIAPADMPPATQKDKNTLIDFICPVCHRTYQYGEKEGQDVLCECQKAKIVPLDSELGKFCEPVPPAPQETAQDAPGSTKIPATERYYCPKCEGTFGTAKGAKKTICPNPNCLALGVIDRWAKKESQ